MVKKRGKDRTWAHQVTSCQNVFEYAVVSSMPPELFPKRRHLRFAHYIFNVKFLHHLCSESVDCKLKFRAHFVGGRRGQKMRFFPVRTIWMAPWREQSALICVFSECPPPFLPSSDTSFSNNRHHLLTARKGSSTYCVGKKRNPIIVYTSVLFVEVPHHPLCTKN